MTYKLKSFSKPFSKFTNRLPSCEKTGSLTVLFLMILAIALRLWGVNWPRLHPDEWTFTMVEHLSTGSLYYPHGEIWHQAFFNLCALFYAVVKWIVSNFTWLLGPASETKSSLDVVLLCRALGGILGGLNVWACYRLAQKMTGSIKAGLLAGALIAVSPLLVAQNHYLTVDGPLALAATFCLWACLNISSQTKLRYYLIAGFTFGLTVTTKSNAVIIIISFVTAHLLAVYEARPNWKKWLLAQPGTFLGGAFTGLFVGYPGFLIDGANILHKYLYLWQKYTKPRFTYKGTWLDSPMADRLGWSSSVLYETVGISIILLALTAIVIAVWKKRKYPLIIASYPVCFFMAYLAMANRLGERDLTSLVPSLVCLAVYSLVFLYSRFTKFKYLRLSTAIVVGLLLVLPGLWQSIKVSYIFWQGDTRIQAREWVNHALPPWATVYLPYYAPPAIERTSNYINDIYNLNPEEYTNENDYLLYCSLGSARFFHSLTGKTRSKRGRFVVDLEKRMQLIKSFDLKIPGKEKLWPGKRNFPVFANPLIQVFSTLPPKKIKQPLVLPHPSQQVEQSYLLAYTNHADYSLDQAIATTSYSTTVERVLRTPSELKTAEVELVHLGDTPVKTNFSQGPFLNQNFVLNPGQILVKEIDCQQWPLPMERVYPFKTHVEMPEPVLMRVITDPLILGQRFLQRNQWQKAKHYLQKAFNKSPEALLNSGLLACALTQLGDYKQAQELLKDKEKALNTLSELTFSPLATKPWMDKLIAFTGYHQSLLLNSLTKHYKIAPYALDVLSQELLKGTGYKGASMPLDQGKGHMLKIWLADIFPCLPLNAKFTLTWPKEFPQRDSTLVTLDVVRHNNGIFPQKEKLTLIQSDFSPNREKGVFSLKLNPKEVGDRWEIRLTTQGNMPCHLKNVKITIDPKAILQASAKWCFLAKANLLLYKEEYEKAATLFDQMAKLYPNFRPAIKPHVISLLKTNQFDQVSKRLIKSKSIIWNYPQDLAFAHKSLKKAQAHKPAKAFYKRWLLLTQNIQPVEFNKDIVLLKSRISKKTLKAGKKLKLDLVWRVKNTPPADYIVVLHLLGPDKMRVFDHRVGQGRFKFNRLKPGETVVDSLDIPIPPKAAGKYKFKVGLLQEGATHRHLRLIPTKRLKITQGPNKGQDAHVLGGFTVSP